MLQSVVGTFPPSWKSKSPGQVQLYYFLIALVFQFSPTINGSPINRQAGISENVYITVQNDTYGIEQRVCSIDSMTYEDGESILSSTPCEHCVCRPPGFACTIISCEYRPGCKSLKRSDQCCPDYQCECEANGKIYQNGDKILDDNNPCEICYCQGGEVSCAVIDCYWRIDCQPRYIENRCCPLYDHCPPLLDQIRPTQTPVNFTTTTPGNHNSWHNQDSAIYATPSTTRKSITSSTVSSTIPTTTTPPPPPLLSTTTTTLPTTTTTATTTSQATSKTSQTSITSPTTTTTTTIPTSPQSVTENEQSSSTSDELISTTFPEENVATSSTLHKNESVAHNKEFEGTVLGSTVKLDALAPPVTDSTVGQDAHSPNTSEVPQPSISFPSPQEGEQADTSEGVLTESVEQNLVNMGTALIEQIGELTTPIIVTEFLPSETLAPPISEIVPIPASTEIPIPENVTSSMHYQLVPIVTTPAASSPEELVPVHVSEEVKETLPKVQEQSNEIIFADDNPESNTTSIPINPTMVPQILSDGTPISSSIQNSDNILEETVTTFIPATAAPNDPEEIPTSNSLFSDPSLGEGETMATMPNPSQGLQLGVNAVDGVTEIVLTQQNVAQTQVMSNKINLSTDSGNTNQLAPDIGANKTVTSPQQILKDDVLVFDVNVDPELTESPANIGISGNISTSGESATSKDSSSSSFTNVETTTDNALSFELNNSETGDLADDLQSNTAIVESLVEEIPQIVTTTTPTIVEFTTPQLNQILQESTVIESNSDEVPVFDENITHQSVEIKNESNHDVIPNTTVPKNQNSELAEGVAQTVLPDGGSETTLRPLEEKFRLDMSIFSDGFEETYSGTESGVVGTTENDVTFESNSPVPVVSSTDNIYPDGKDIVNLTLSHEGEKKNLGGDPQITQSHKFLQRHHILGHPEELGATVENEVENATTEPPFESNKGSAIIKNILDSENKEKESGILVGVEVVKKVDPISDDIETENSRADLRIDAENEIFNANTKWYW